MNFLFKDYCNELSTCHCQRHFKDICTHRLSHSEKQIHYLLNYLILSANSEKIIKDETNSSNQSLPLLLR